MSSKKTNIRISGYGFRVQGDFISEKLYQKLKNEVLEDDSRDILESKSDHFIFGGVNADSFRFLLDEDVIIEEINDISNHFTLTIPPEKEFLKFNKSKKYGLVMVEHEKGVWYEDDLLIKDPELLVFTNKRIEISPTTYFSFINAFYDGIELEMGETMVQHQDFYIVSSDGDIKELIFEE